MMRLFKNSFTVKLYNFIKNRYIEINSNNLSIKSSVAINHCVFGEFNVVYKDCSLNRVTLGDYTYIAPSSSISNASFGKFCSIGPGCRIGLGKHPTNYLSTHPVFFSNKKQAGVSFTKSNYFKEYEPINIGNDVWVGANVVVVDGVTVGNGAIIAAGSVIVKDVPPYAIVGGNPAKLIRMRFSDDVIESLSELEWWNSTPAWLFKHIECFQSEFTKDKLFSLIQKD